MNPRRILDALVELSPHEAQGWEEANHGRILAVIGQAIAAAQGGASWPAAPDRLAAPLRGGAGGDVTPYTTEGAIEAVHDMAASLAALPPPQDEKDDVGFSAANDRPMRSYLGMVEAGLDLPLSAHLNAARMLILHTKTQLPRGEVIGAIRALEAAVRQERAAVGDAREVVALDAAAKKPGTADYLIADPRGGSVDKESAQYRAGGAFFELRLPARKVDDGSGRKSYAGSALRTYLQDNGAPRLGYRQAGADYWWRIPVEYAVLTANWLIDHTFPLTGAALLQVAPAWLKGRAPAGSRQEAPRADGPALDPATTSARDRALAALSGKVPLPGAPAPARQAGPSPDVGKAGGIEWTWDAPQQGIILRYDYDRARAPAEQLAGAMRRAGIQHKDLSNRNTRDYKYLVPVQAIPGLIALMEAENRYPAGVAALRALLPTWEGRLQAAKKPVTREDRLAGSALLRRMSHMMDGETAARLAASPQAAEEAVAEVAGLLADVKPGTDRADLGAFGSWRLETWQPGKEEIVIEAPGAQATLANVGRRTQRQDPRTGAYAWVTVVPLKEAPAAAQALDKAGNMPLALSLRLALLSDAEEKLCPELEVLSGALSIADIPDAEIREQVRRLVGGIRLPPGMSFREYQKVGIAHAYYTGFRDLIGDAMGLGKTAQAIGSILLDPTRLLPALVVAPGSVAGSGWPTDIRKFAPHLRVTFLAGTRDKGLADLGTRNQADVTIVTWDGLRLLKDALLGRFKLAIFDEAHRAKNPQSQRSKAAREIAHATPHVLELSGTPIENRAEEAWHLLHMLDRKKWADASDFKERFAGGAGKRVVKTVGPDGAITKRKFNEPADIRGLADRTARQLAELRDRLRCFMVRRLKSDVLTELPPKTRRMVEVALPPQVMAAYAKAENALPGWLCAMAAWSIAEAAGRWLVAARREADLKGEPWPAEEDAIDAVLKSRETEDVSGNLVEMGLTRFLMQWALVAYGALRRLIGAAKIPVACEWIADYLEDTDGAPLVVIAEHKPVIAGIAACLRDAGVRYGVIDGSLPVPKRAAVADAFQAGAFPVIILSTAAREGLTLTRADTGLFVEQWWIPAWMEQGEDRIHRIGQLSSVVWNHLLARGTVDGQIRALIDDKEAITGAVLGREATKITGSGGSLKRAIIGPAIAAAQELAGRGRCRVGAEEVRAAIAGELPRPRSIFPADLLADAEEGGDDE